MTRSHSDALWSLTGLVMVVVAAIFIGYVFQGYRDTHPEWYETTSHNVIGGR